MNIQLAQTEFQEITQKIKALEKNLEVIASLALKPSQEWTDIERQVYIDHDRLNLRDHDLRQEMNILNQQRTQFLSVLIPPAQPSNCLLISFCLLTNNLLKK
jgi:hypothetical protein